MNFIRETSTKADSRFLEYLPITSIPVERSDLSECYIITYRGRYSEDLKRFNVKFWKKT